VADTERWVLGFDVGGSHVAAAVCRDGDFGLGTVVSAPHPEGETAEAFVDLLYRLSRDAGADREPLEGAILAVPGPFDLEAGVSRMQHKLPYLYGFDLRHALSGRLGMDAGRVRFLNDANAYLLGEIGAGAARGFARTIGLTLGTGIGSAFAVGGRIVTEGRGVPPDGEIWNLPYNGATVEDFVSTRAIAGAYQRSTGRSCAVVDIAWAAKCDAEARAAFEEFGRSLGRVIRTVLAEFEADAIVLGGGIARSAELFLDAARGELPQGPLELRIAELAERAPLVGCGVAWFAGCAAAIPAEPQSAGTIAD